MDYSRKNQISKQIMNFIIHEQFEQGAQLPTIRDMADMFKVSIDTVQKAVGILKKDGVIEARQGHGLFVKSLLPKTGKSRKIGLVFSNDPSYLNGYPYPGNIIDTIRERLEKAGYKLVTYPLAKKGIFNFKERILKLNCAGLLLFEVEYGFWMREIIDIHLPVVSIDYDYGRFGVPTVKFDNVMNAILLTNHLLYEQGHTSIAFLASSYRRWFSNTSYQDADCEERLEGYRIAMNLAGLAPHIINCGPAASSESTLAKAVSSLLSSKPMPTALVCDSNRLALRFIEEAKQFGCFVPDDISVGGFGPAGMEFASGKNLSCGLLDLQTMGDTAARYILSCIQGQLPDPIKYLLPAEFSAGDSVSRIDPNLSRIPFSKTVSGSDSNEK